MGESGMSPEIFVMVFVEYRMTATSGEELAGI